MATTTPKSGCAAWTPISLSSSRSWSTAPSPCKRRSTRHAWRAFPYGVDDDQPEEGDDQPKSFIEVNWLLPEYEDTALVMALEILAYALLYTPASPLRKALIDSDLGEDVIGGLSSDTRQMTFSAGLKGVDPADVERVEPLILDTLAALADDGFDPDMIAASINTIEFALRENNTGRFPRGLALFIRSLSTWLHDRDPLAPLAYAAPLAAAKERLAAEPGYLQTLIRRYFLDNPHRATVILEPDPQLNQRQEAAERERLDRTRAAMSDDEAHAVIETARALKEAQDMPDPPEVLAMLPSLGLEDLDKAHKVIPIEVRDLETGFLPRNPVSGDGNQRPSSTICLPTASSTSIWGWICGRCPLPCCPISACSDRRCWRWARTKRIMSNYPNASAARRAASVRTH